jgi:hypothetical protein
VDWKKRGMLHRLQIHKDVNPLQAVNLPKYFSSCSVVVLLCCWMYIPDLPTYLLFYLETTCGSSIDTLMTTTLTPTHFKSFYIPELASNHFHLSHSNMSN